MAPDFRLATFSCCLDPFLCRQRLGSSKKGSCDLASNFAFGATFSAALPHRDAVPVLALSLFLLLLLAVALCAAVVVWICPLCSTICRAYLLSQVCLAQSVERKALNLKLDGSTYCFFCQSCGCCPCRAEKSVLVLSFSLSCPGCTYVISLFLLGSWSWLSLCGGCCADILLCSSIS